MSYSPTPCHTAQPRGQSSPQIFEPPPGHRQMSPNTSQLIQNRRRAQGHNSAPPRSPLLPAECPRTGYRPDGAAQLEDRTVHPIQIILCVPEEEWRAFKQLPQTLRSPNCLRGQVKPASSLRKPRPTTVEQMVSPASQWGEPQERACPESELCPQLCVSTGKHPALSELQNPYRESEGCQHRLSHWPAVYGILEPVPGHTGRAPRCSCPNAASHSWSPAPVGEPGLRVHSLEPRLPGAGTVPDTMPMPGREQAAGAVASKRQRKPHRTSCFTLTPAASCLSLPPPACPCRLPLAQRSELTQVVCIAEVEGVAAVHMMVQCLFNQVLWLVARKFRHPVEGP